MNYTFKLEDDEIKVFEKWKDEQMKKSDKLHSSVGGRWSFVFTTTGVGIIAEAKDNNNGETKTLTNFDNW